MIETVFENIVKNTASAYGKNIFCHIGNSNNIAHELKTLSTLNVKRFPLIAFMRPFRIKEYSAYYDVTVRRIAIATATVLKDSEKKKVETNFNDVLRPILAQFKTVINEDKNILVGVHGIELNVEDMPYFNQGLEPKGNEQMDGIVMDNVVFRIKKSNCNCN